MSQNQDKSIVLHSSYKEKRVSLNPDYKNLPEPVIRELSRNLSELSEKTECLVQLSIIYGSKAMIELYSETGTDGSLGADVKSAVDSFIKVHEKLLDSIGTFHYLYFTEEGAKYRKLLVDE